MILKRLLAALTLGVIPAILLTGCPGNQPTEGSGKLSVLLSANDAGMSAKTSPVPKARVVQLAEVTNITVVVDQIALESESGAVVVVDQPFDINLLDILNMPNLVDTATVPAGAYTGAVLTLSGATAVFADAPDVPVPVDLLDGGNLRVPITFDMVEGDDGLLVFDLGAITLVELDAGGYQLVPDLSVDLFNAVQAQVRGEIVEAYPEDSYVVVQRGDAAVVVDVLDAAVFLPDDFDVANGTVADLAVGVEVVAIGTLNFDGSLTADTVAILDIPDDDDVEPAIGKIRYTLVSTGIDPDAGGYAEYHNYGDHNRLKVKMDDLTLVNVVEVAVDGVVLGDASVNHHSEKAMLHLVSARGDTVPIMTVDSIIEVFDAETGERLLVSEVGVLHESGHHGHDDDHEGDDDESDNDDDEGDEGEGDDDDDD